MLIGVGKQRPGLVANGLPVRIDAQVFCFNQVTGEMKVFDPFFRHREQELARVVFVVDAVDDDIVDVEE